MKKWLLAAGLGLAMVTSAQAADKIAMVNMNSLFQQVAQKTGVSNTLENEFKGRASELQRMEGDLQSKMQRLQSMQNYTVMAISSSPALRPCSPHKRAILPSW